MNLFPLSLGILTLAACLDGCTTIHIKNENSLQSFAKSENTRTVALLSDDWETDDIEDCIDLPVKDADSNIRLISAKQLHNQLLPFFMPSTTPHSQEEFQQLMANPLIRKRLNSLGIQYIVTIIKHNNTDMHNHIGCGGGYGGAACLGAAWWNKESNIAATLWDIDRTSKGTIEVGATGTGIAVAPLIPIPLYFPATESANCKEISKRLRQALD